MVFFVDFLEFEHRPGTPAFGLGTLNEGVGDMLMQPGFITFVLFHGEMRTRGRQSIWESIRIRG